MQAEASAPRPTLRVRTTMSYAFERALGPYLAGPASAVTPLVRSVAERMASGFRTIPTWTVSKREQAPDKRKRRR